MTQSFTLTVFRCFSRSIKVSQITNPQKYRTNFVLLYDFFSLGIKQLKFANKKRKMSKKHTSIEYWYIFSASQKIGTTCTSLHFKHDIVFLSLGHNRRPISPRSLKTTRSTQSDYLNLACSQNSESLMKYQAVGKQQQLQ